MRGRAATAIAAVVQKDAVPLLIDQMKMEKRNDDMRRAAGEHCVDSDWVRSDIAEALGMLGPDAVGAVPVLSAIVADADEKWFLKRAAAESLGKIGPAAVNAVPQLVILLTDEDVDLRYGAAEALGKIGPGASAVAPRLFQMSKSDPNQDVRDAARTAVQRIGKEIPKEKEKRKGNKS
jgi:HEAT repeat protein